MRTKDKPYIPYNPSAAIFASKEMLSSEHTLQNDNSKPTICTSNGGDCFPKSAFYFAKGGNQPLNETNHLPISEFCLANGGNQSLNRGNSLANDGLYKPETDIDNIRDIPTRPMHWAIQPIIQLTISDTILQFNPFIN